MEEAVASIKKEMEDPVNDYVDGTVYSRSTAVVMTGVLTDEKPISADVQTFSRSWDPWFYMYVEEKVIPNHPGNGCELVDYIPIRDYLFRYNWGGFWVGREASGTSVSCPSTASPGGFSMTSCTRGRCTGRCTAPDATPAT